MPPEISEEAVCHWARLKIGRRSSAKCDWRSRSMASFWAAMSGTTSEMGCGAVRSWRQDQATT